MRNSVEKNTALDIGLKNRFQIFILFIFIALHIYPASTKGKEDEFEKIIKRRKELLVPDKFNKKDSDIGKKLALISEEAYSYWGSMDKLLWRTFLWIDLSDKSSSENIVQNLIRLRSLALAYSTTGTKLTKNKKLKTDIIFALDWLYKNQYNENLNFSGKWIDYEVNIPLILNDIIVLMHDDLSKVQRERLIRSIFRFNHDVGKINRNKEVATGVYLVWNCSIHVISGAIIKDLTRVDSSTKALTSVFEIGENNKGLYGHSFFFQDKNVNGGEYSIQLLAGTTGLLYLLQGTAWQAPHKKIENVQQWLFNSFDPIIYGDKIIDIEGKKGFEPVNNEQKIYEIINSSLLIAQILNSADSTRKLIKKWFIPLNKTEYFNHASIKSITLAKNILEDNNLIALSHNSAIEIFAKKVVIKRPHFASSIDTFSEEVANDKVSEIENDESGYFSYGAITFYYINGKTFNPKTMDFSRLPGTTIPSIQKNPEANQKKTGIRRVGVTEIEKEYGIVGMEFEDVGLSLKAKKSWFLFDNELVALGTGIKCKENISVETIIDNRLILSKESSILINGEEENIDNQQSSVLKSPEWIHFNWLNDSMGTGYYFPKYYELDFSVNERRQRMDLINQGIKDAPIIDKYLTLALNHGSKTQAGHYQYIVLPYISSAAIKNYDKNPDVIILQNNNQLHAVKEKNLGIIAANFWNDEKTILSVDANFIITCDRAVSFIYKEKGNEAEVSLSTLDQKAGGSIIVEIYNKDFSEVLMKDTEVRVKKSPGFTTLTFDVEDNKRGNLSVKFRLPQIEAEN